MTPPNPPCASCRTWHGDTGIGFLQRSNGVGLSTSDLSGNVGESACILLPANSLYDLSAHAAFIHAILRSGCEMKDEVNGRDTVPGLKSGNRASSFNYSRQCLR